MRRVCKRIAPNLNLPKKDPIGDDTIVMFVVVIIIIEYSHLQQIISKTDLLS